MYVHIVSYRTYVRRKKRSYEGTYSCLLAAIALYSSTVICEHAVRAGAISASFEVFRGNFDVVLVEKVP